MSDVDGYLINDYDLILAISTKISDTLKKNALLTKLSLCEFRG